MIKKTEKWIGLRVSILYIFCIILIPIQESRCEDAQADPEIEALRKAAAILDQQKLIVAAQLKIAEDEKKMRETTFGPTLAPRDGSISVTGNKAEAATIAHHQMSLIAQAMARKVKAGVSPGARTASVLLLAGSPDAELLAATRGYIVVKQDLDSIAAILDSATRDWNEDRESADTWLTPPSVEPQALGGGLDILTSASPYTAVLNSALSSLALLRVDRVFTAVEITEDNDAFVAMLGNSLRQERAFGDVSVGWLDSSSKSRLFSSLVDLDGKRVAAKYASAEIGSRVAIANKYIEDFKPRIATATKQVSDANKEIVALTNKKTEKDAKSAEIDKAISVQQVLKDEAKAELEFIGEFSEKIGSFFALVNPHLAKLNPSLSRADGYFTELPQQKLMGFGTQALLKAERLVQTDGYILFAKVNYADGTNLTRRTLLTNSFSAAAAISVSCVIQDKEGKHVFSTTEYDYRFHKANDKSHGSIPSSIEIQKDTSASRSNSSTRLRIGARHR